MRSPATYDYPSIAVNLTGIVLRTTRNRCRHAAIVTWHRLRIAFGSALYLALQAVALALLLFWALIETISRRALPRERAHWQQWLDEALRE
jgi:hypothetical protein